MTLEKYFELFNAFNEEERKLGKAGKLERILESDGSYSGYKFNEAADFYNRKKELIDNFLKEDFGSELTKWYTDDDTYDIEYFEFDTTPGSNYYDKIRIHDKENYNNIFTILPWYHKGKNLERFLRKSNIFWYVDFNDNGDDIWWTVHGNQIIFDNLDPDTMEYSYIEDRIEVAAK